jgi:hypothetical protein
LTGCGGSEPQEDLSTDTEMVEEESTEETETTEVEETAEKLDLSSFSSADEAMDEYKSLIEEYSELVKNGSAEEAKALKAQLDELKSFSEDKWGKASLKAMANLSKVALQLEAGKDIDLDDALNAYDKSLDAIKNMPGMDAETEKAMSETQDAMKQLKSLGF